jgi:tetratricopeptide (TPR) repeat protein
LRSLGQALLRQGDTEVAGRIVQEIENLDPDAFTVNAECAAFRGSWLCERGNLAGAIDVYKTALANNPRSYYLADILGQAQLRDQDLDGARATYRKARDILRSLSEHNIWTEATAATAALVVGQQADVIEHLRRIGSMNPSGDNKSSILKGLQEVRHALALPGSLGAEWEETLG